MSTIRTLVVLPVATVIALGVACTGDKSHVQTVPGSLRASAGAAGAATTNALALEGTTACDTLARLVKVPSMQVLAFSSDSSLPDPANGTPDWRRGCAVQLKDSTDTTGAPMQPLEQWFTSHGWFYTQYSADGPDGELFGYADNRRLCIVRGTWDGGNDADTTYVPAPGYEMSIACAPAISADTAGYGVMHAQQAEVLKPRPIVSGALACPVPGDCGIAPPLVPPAAMTDLQHLVAAARLRSRTWPASAALPLVDTVAKHGRAVARAIAAMLPADSTVTADWNVHVEQQLELALCAIYDIKPEAGKTVWGPSAGQAANRAVRQYWRDRVKNGS